MLKHLTTPVRILLLATVLAFAAQAAEVRAANEPTPTATLRATARTKGEAQANNRDEFPLEGVLVVVGVVAFVILLAWVCSRFGDTR